MSLIKKFWMPIALVVIGIGVVGAIYYNKAVYPKKQIDKSIGYIPEDYITLGQYKGIEYAQSELGVSEKELEEAIAEELIDYEAVDRAAQKGDSVNIDYVAFVDGAKDDNLSETDFDILVGDQDLAKEFDDAVIGKKTGDKFKVAVADVSYFPTFEEKDYAGKKVEFEVTVNGVFQEYTAELNDEWVKEWYGEEYGCTTVEEYKKLMRETILEENEETRTLDTYTALWDIVLNNCVMNSYPQEAYDEIVAIDDADMLYAADEWGMSLESYYEFLEMDKKDIEEMYLKDVKSELVMWAIAKAEGIEVTNSEINQGYEDMYEDYDYESAADMKKDYTKKEIRRALMEEKVIEFVAENAVLSEVPSTEAVEEVE